MRKIFLAILLLTLVGGVVTYVMYNKPHQNISDLKAEITVSSEQLFADFENDESTANKKYLDKLVQVNGEIMAISKTETGMPQVTLSSDDELSGVICELDELSDHPRVDFEIGEKVSFKGKCSGMLMDVVLVRCVEIK